MFESVRSRSQAHCAAFPSGAAMLHRLKDLYVESSCLSPFANAALLVDTIPIANACKRITRLPLTGPLCLPENPFLRGKLHEATVSVDSAGRRPTS